MAIRNISISNTFVRAAVRHSNKAGLAPEQLLRLAGIAPDLLHQPHARIPVTHFARLVNNTIIALNDEFLGYGAGKYLPGTWRNMCYATLHTNNLGHALARFCRFYQMFNTDIQPYFESSTDQLKVTFRTARQVSDYENYAWEQFLFNTHRYVSWLTRQHVPLVSVNFHYHQPDYVEEYRNLFLGNPVYFDQPESAIVFHSSQRLLPIVQNERSLRRLLHHPHLILLAQQYKQRSHSAKVRQQLSRSLQNIPSIEEVAASMDLHPQTLRRRLAGEGTSYNEIKAQCRRDTALYYLGRSTMSIEQIALQAGFSETSAFTRAFKEWTGVAPQNYRRRR